MRLLIGLCVYLYLTGGILTWHWTNEKGPIPRFGAAVSWPILTPVALLIIFLSDYVVPFFKHVVKFKHNQT